MNSEEFNKSLYSCSTQKELDALKKELEVELSNLSNKNTDINGTMKTYILNNYDLVIQRIFVTPNEEFKGGFVQKAMFKQANSLERHLKVPMGTFFHTWNGLKLQRLENFKKTVEEHKDLMKTLGNKQYKEQLEKFKHKEEQIKEMAW